MMHNGRADNRAAAGRWERRAALGGRVVRCDLRVLLAGVALNLLGLLLPLIITDRTLGILEELSGALMEDSASRLLSASLRLVLLNIIRSTPHYIGVLLLTLSLDFSPPSVLLSAVKYLLSFAVLAGAYQLIGVIYDIHYVVKWPAIIVLVLAARIKVLPVRLPSKMVVIFLLLMSVQGMDIVPGMEGLGFGQGEIAMDIKRAGHIMRCGDLLTAFSMLLFFAFAISALLMTRLANEKQQLQSAMSARNDMEKVLIETRIKAAEMRNDREMQSLVHDLKSPLTTIQGLSSLTSTLTADPAIREYQRRLSDAAERMSRMISEILYADKREVIDVAAFIQRVLSHFSANEGARLVRAQVDCPDCRISVNVIRMIRAVINVLENACKAIDPKTGRVLLGVEADAQRVYLTVRDNGRGIPREELDKIWLPGYSGMVSTGLGLAFVRQVVEGHQGTVNIESEEGTYTLVTIALKRDKEEQHG